MFDLKPIDHYSIVVYYINTIHHLLFMILYNIVERIFINYIYDDETTTVDIFEIYGRHYITGPPIFI